MRGGELILGMDWQIPCIDSRAQLSSAACRSLLHGAGLAPQHVPSRLSKQRSRIIPLGQICQWAL